MKHDIAYRLSTRERWAEVMMEGQFSGEAIDKESGFIHLSAAHQIEDTLLKHYDGHDRLVLVEINLKALGTTVKWEKSRGGDEFPHVYGVIPATAVNGFRLMRRNEEGAWVLPQEALE